VVSKNSMKFLDSDASNFVELKSPATVASNVTLTLPATAGKDGEVLKTDGSRILSWVASAAGTFAWLTDTDMAGLAVGATIYFDGTNWVDLPKGTAGQALAMNAGATAPEWVDGAASGYSFQEVFVQTANWDNITHNFTVEANKTVILQCSASAYRANAGDIGFIVYVDNQAVRYVHTLTNNTTDHDATITSRFQLNGLSAGTHQLKFYPYSGTAVDSNDYMNASIEQF
jgi:hypothetical protein